MAESVPDPSDLPRAFHLREVTARLRKILLPTTQKEFWIRVQFVPDRTRKAEGHCYGHLVEIVNVQPSSRTTLNDLMNFGKRNHVSTDTTP